MRATLTLDASGETLRVAVENGGVYKASAAQKFSDEARAAILGIAAGPGDIAKNKKEQGAELTRYIPRGFHKLIADKAKRLEKEGLILLLESPSLADYPWEYIPVMLGTKSAGPKPDYWQNLPMLRSIPGSTYARRYYGWANIRKCFFNVALDAANIMEEIGIFTEHDAFLPGDYGDLRTEFFNSLAEADFIHIASHCKTGALISGEETGPHNPYCEPGGELNSAVLPRLALADCCKSAEAGPGGRGWEYTLPGGFVRKKGAAVFIGNIGDAVYSNGRTQFAHHFITMLFNGAYMDGSFNELVRQVRLILNEAKNQSQVIYIASDLNPGCRVRDLLLAEGIPPARDRPVYWPEGVLACLCALSALTSFAFGRPDTLPVCVAGITFSIVYAAIKRVRYIRE